MDEDRMKNGQLILVVRCLAIQRVYEVIKQQTYVNSKVAR